MVSYTPLVPHSCSSVYISHYMYHSWGTISDKFMIAKEGGSTKEEAEKQVWNLKMTYLLLLSILYYFGMNQLVSVF